MAAKADDEFGVSRVCLPVAANDGFAVVTGDTGAGHVLRQRALAEDVVGVVAGDVAKAAVLVVLAADEEVFVADAFNGDGRVRTQTRHTAGVYAHLARGQAIAVNAHGVEAVAVQDLRGATGVNAATAGDGVACAVVGLAVVDVVIGLRAIWVIRQAVVVFVLVAAAGGEQKGIEDDESNGVLFHGNLRLGCVCCRAATTAPLCARQHEGLMTPPVTIRHEKRAADAALGDWRCLVAGTFGAEAAVEVLCGVVEDTAHFGGVVAVEVTVALDCTVTAEAVAVDGGVKADRVERESTVIGRSLGELALDGFLSEIRGNFGGGCFGIRRTSHDAFTTIAGAAAGGHIRGTFTQTEDIVVVAFVEIAKAAGVTVTADNEELVALAVDFAVAVDEETADVKTGNPGQNLCAADIGCVERVCSDIDSLSGLATDRDDIGGALIFATDRIVWRRRGIGLRCGRRVGLRYGRGVVIAATAIRIGRAIVVAAAASAGCK